MFKYQQDFAFQKMNLLKENNMSKFRHMKIKI